MHGVHGARDAVFNLEVQLGDDVDIVDGSVLQVTLGGGLDHVAHHKALHGLVLGNAARAVRAAHVDDRTCPRFLRFFPPFLRFWVMMRH